MNVEGSFTLKVESEQDILLLAELIQRRNGTPSRHRKVMRSEVRQTLSETQQRIIGLIRSKYPQTDFRAFQAKGIVSKEMDVGRTTIDNALKSAVKAGELHKVSKGKYSFLPQSPGLSEHALNASTLLDVIGDTPDNLLEVCRLVKAISGDISLVFSHDRLYCRLNDAHGQIMLDMAMDKSLFSAYHVKQPIEIRADVSALCSRLEKAKMHLSMKEELGPLLIGDFELKLESCRPFTGEIPTYSNELETCSELLIAKQQLEKVLTDNAVNAQHIDIMAEADKLHFRSHTEQGDYNPDPLFRNYKCTKPSKSRLHYTDVLLRCLKASKCEQVRIINSGTFLQVRFPISEAIKADLYLACKKLEDTVPVLAAGSGA